MKLTLLSLIAVLSASAAFGAGRDLLVNSITQQRLEQILAEQTGWPVFPSYSDRTAWESLPYSIRESYTKAGERSLDYQWGVIPAMSYIEFIRSGDRSVMERPANARSRNLTNLVLAELMEGKGRFIEQIINGVWAICEQTTWVASAHLPAQKGGAGLPNPDDTIIDLFSSRTGALISWIHYFFADEFDKVSPYINRRIRDEVRARILVPYYTRDNFFWQGFDGRTVNNWNTYCNYYVLTTILLMETDPQLKAANTFKVMRSLDHFINGYPDDGGCDEGPSYWTMSGGKLFESLEVLYAATGGWVDVLDDDKIHNIGRYVYRAYIGDDYVTDFADAPVTMRFDPGVLFRFGRAIDDLKLMKFGAWMAQKYNKDGNFDGALDYTLMNLFHSMKVFEYEAQEPFARDSWFPDTELVMARDREGSKEGFYFAAKGGHNNESHNHNDIGTFILYYDAKPVLIDIGVGTYMRQTFGPERYSIWNMRSLYHNVPVINGQEQRFGRNYASRDVNYSSTYADVDFSLDLAAAYPEETAVNSWVRSYKLTRGKSFAINDTWNLKSNKGGNALVFMTVSEVEPDPRKGVIYLKGEGFTLRMKYDPSRLDLVTETIDIDDSRIAEAWGDTISRITLNVKSKARTGSASIEITEVK